MGIKDVFKKITQAGDEPDYNTDYTDDPYGTYDPETDDGYGMGVPQQEDMYAPVQEQPVYQQPARPQNINISGSAIELKVVKPESYKNASQIADHLLSGRTVVLNLESTNKETARRLIDFLTGAAYAIGGDIKKVSNNTYVITPGDSVAVSGDKLQAEPKPAQAQAPAQAEEGTEYFEL